MTHREKGFTLVELMIVVSIIGILAAVAIPSFLNYIRKAKTAEAPQQIAKISNGARIYFLEDHGSTPGVAIPPQFPATVTVTPGVTCCAGGIERCTPNPADWNDPTWQALQYSMEDPHYFRYEFISAGVSVDAAFTARAFGDLDCDGVLSTFTAQGEVQFLGNDMTGSGTLSRISPLE